MKRLGYLVLSVAVLGSRAQACDLCAMYNPTDPLRQETAGFLAGVAEQFTYFGTEQEDGHEVPNPSGQYLDSSVSQVFAGYNFSDRLGVQFNMPLIYRYYKRPDGMGGIEYGTVAGLGDVALLGDFIPYRRITEDFSLVTTILGGVKFPTGSTDRLAEELNEVEDPVGPPSAIHGHDLTLGSGSYDGIVGAGVSTRWQRAFFTATLQYAIRSTGDFDYRFANDLTGWGGPGYYLIMGEKCSFALQALVSGETKGMDTFEGAPAEDTGIASIYVGPQLVFSWGHSLSANLGVDIPVSLQNTALQVVPNYRVHAGLTWHF